MFNWEGSCIMPQSYFILENWIFQIETTVYFSALSRPWSANRGPRTLFFYYQRYKQTPCGMKNISTKAVSVSLFHFFFLVVNILPKGMFQECKFYISASNWTKQITRSVFKHTDHDYDFRIQFFRVNVLVKFENFGRTVN